MDDEVKRSEHTRVVVDVARLKEVELKNKQLDADIAYRERLLEEQKRSNQEMEKLLSEDDDQLGYYEIPYVSNYSYKHKSVSLKVLWTIVMFSIIPVALILPQYFDSCHYIVTVPLSIFFYVIWYKIGKVSNMIDDY